jgi:HD-GYP domain-containing protein (c-di-GMP phosphodiesterase class II)
MNDLHRSSNQMNSDYDALIEICSRALELRSLKAEGHTRNVVEMVERLARRLGVGEPDIVHLSRGARLYDIGKANLPDSVLFKLGSLTEDEWRAVREHPVYAHQVLSPITSLRPALDIPYCHHEWWDGTGYPRGLKGEQIPIGARIFAVVHAWESLRAGNSDQPPDETLRQIRAAAGTQFDPKVVEAFENMVQAEDR